MEQYLEMLSFMRPAFNPYDDAFVSRYIDVLNPNVDGFGNRWVDVGDEPTIVWSSHTDTVHTRGGFQEVFHDKKKGIARLASKRQGSNCLGADCTSGVWLMLEMIKAGIPGRYIFHRQEEDGGVGSKWIRQHNPAILHGIKAAIAFDRRGKKDVITEQGSIPTASSEFAKSFAFLLGGGYKPSPYGSYTDTKEYRSLVPECTNIAVGYEDAHTARETQDLNHLEWLRDTLCALTPDDLATLVIKRDPATPDPIFSQGYGGYHSWQPPRTVEDLCYRYPKTLANLLTEYGWDFDTLYTELERTMKGTPRKGNKHAA